MGEYRFEAKEKSYFNYTADGITEQGAATGNTRTHRQSNDRVSVDDYLRQKHGGKQVAASNPADTPGSALRKKSFAQAKKEFARKVDQQIQEQIDDDVGLKTGYSYAKGSAKTGSKTYHYLKKYGRKAIDNYKASHTPEAQAAREHIKELKFRGSSGYQATDAATKSQSNLAGASKLQKQIYKRQQQIKLYMDRAKSAAAKAGQGVSSAVSALGKLLGNALGKYKYYIAGGAAALLLLISSFQAGGTAVISFLTTFTSEPQIVEDSALYLTQLDADLEYRVQHMQDERPDIDQVEITYTGTGIVRTNQLQAAAYLSVLFENNMPLDAAKQEMDAMHEYLYTVTERIEEETRGSTYTDPDTGEYVDDTYTYRTLYVEVECRPFESYIDQPGKLTGESREWFELLMESGGNLATLGNPFVDAGADWRQLITTNYGYRVHPITGDKEMHPALDIVQPAGTSINAVQSGKVLTVRRGHSIYGNYVVIWDEAADMKTMYAHCTDVLVSEGQTVERGAVIATVGSTGQSTGAHLHIEVSQKGKYLNPLFALL